MANMTSPRLGLMQMLFGWLFALWTRQARITWSMPGEMPDRDEDLLGLARSCKTGDWPDDTSWASRKGAPALNPVTSWRPPTNYRRPQRWGFARDPHAASPEKLGR